MHRLSVVMIIVLCRTCEWESDDISSPYRESIDLYVKSSEQLKYIQCCCIASSEKFFIIRKHNYGYAIVLGCFLYSGAVGAFRKISSRPKQNGTKFQSREVIRSASIQALVTTHYVWDISSSEDILQTLSQFAGPYVKNISLQSQHHYNFRYTHLAFTLILAHALMIR